MAQPAAELDCAQALAAAGDRYTTGAFREALVLVDPCLHDEGSPLALRRESLRLAILSHLRLNHPGHAHLLAEALLRLDPAFAPDEVLDPPDFVALFAADPPLRPAAEVLVPDIPEAEPLAEAEAPGAPVRAARAPVALTMLLGTASYGGERGQPGGTGLDSFAANAGISLGASLLVPLRPALRAGPRLQLHYLPGRFFYYFAEPVVLERDASSAWTFTLLAEAAWLLAPVGGLQAATRLGIGGAFSYLNGEVRPGLMVQPGLDLAWSYAPGVTLLLYTDLGAVLPGTALDLRKTSHIRDGTRAFDLITQFGVGMRYTLP